MHWLHDWFATAAGHELARAETRWLSRRLAGLYARRVLQIGAYGSGCCPAVFGDARQWIMDDWPGGPIDLRANAEVIPLASASVDVVILVHQLEFAEHPHQVIREAARVLAPEGHMLVVNFNPVSLWGLGKLLKRGRGQPPWCGQYFTANRLADWMLLLGLTPTAREGMALLPPALHRGLHRVRGSRLAYSHGLSPGLRWCGGVNLMVGQKRVNGRATPSGHWHRRFELIHGGLGQATGAGARRNANRNVL